MNNSTEPPSAPWEGSYALFQAWQAGEITDAEHRARREAIAARVRRYMNSPPTP